VDFIDMLPIAARLNEPLRAALRGGVSDWPDDLTEDEVRALVVHGVAPLVYAAAPVPQLRAEAIRAAAIEARRADDLVAVLDALATEGVAALVLKGAALAYDLYASPELRPRGDTDLLIAGDQLEAARKVFLRLRYEEQPLTGDEHGMRQTVFTRASGPGVVHMYDVHWAIANTPLFASTMAFTDLLARKRPLPRLGANAHGLGDVDALLLACIHRVAHHHDSERVIWLVDIALLRDRMSRDEHERFWRAAAEARIVGACVRSVEQANAWMSRPDVNRADEWLSREELERDEASRVFLDRDLTRGELLAANLRALPWRARIERLWQVAFPPAAFVQQSFGTRSRLALPWLYLVRGVRGVRRLFRRVGV
jgi:hypothetical protein